MGSRWDNEKKWNLRLEDEETGEKIDPRLSLLGMEESIGTVQIPYFSDDGNKVLERTIPVKKVMTEEGEVFVTTVYDLTLANYGVNRGLGGQEPKDFNDDVPFTPAWQEKMTGVKRELIIQIAREFAQNA